MARTKVEAALAEAEQKHEGDPERVELLRRTRRFKASWIELAEALSEARRSAHFKRWGYASFEEYTKRELHLRQDTVDKLTGSFLFLKKRAPEVLSRDGLDRAIPSYQAVDFLRRAEEQEDAPEDTVSAIRQRVLEDAAPLPKVAREFRDVVFPIGQGDRKKRDMSNVLNVAKRLRELLDETQVVPRKLAAEVGATLDRLLASLSEAA